MLILKPHIFQLSLLKFVSIFFVLTIHTGPFKPIMDCGEVFRWAAGLIDQIARFAVPCFFIVFGHLASGKMSVVSSRYKYLIRYLKLYLVWSVIYVFVPAGLFLSAGLYEYFRSVTDVGLSFFSSPVSLLFLGSHGHLWFLASTIWLIIASPIFGKNNIGLIVAVSLAIIGLVFGSYADVFGLKPYVFINTRNWIFSAGICYWLGAAGAKGKFYISPQYSIVLLLFGIVFHFVEIGLLHRFYGTSLIVHQYVIGTFITAYAMYVVFMNQVIVNERFIYFYKFGDESLGIYLVHPFLMYLINFLLPPFVMRYWPWQLVFPVVLLLLSYCVVIGIKKNAVVRNIML